MPILLLPDEKLSEFKLRYDGLNGVPLPIYKLIGIVFADKVCNPIPTKVNERSLRLATSIHPHHQQIIFISRGILKVNFQIIIIKKINVISI